MNRYYDFVANETPRAPSPWEIEQLLLELERIAPIRRVVEIGVFEGDSLRYWRAFLDPELLIGIDPEPRLILGLDVGVHLIAAPSQDESTYGEVLRLLAGEEIDLLYLDGDHRYEPLRHDWDLYSPHVRSGGIIVLHDAQIRWNETVDTYKLWPELIEGRRSKLLWDGAGGTGLGIIFKP